MKICEDFKNASQQVDVLELKNQILHLKKENGSLKSENTLLKVRIRKLLEEIQKRNKQTESLINPKKNAHFKRLISEKGASMVLELNEENLRLEKILLEKEMTIKKLQKDLELIKVYGMRYKDLSSRTNISQKSSESDVSKNVEIIIPLIQTEKEMMKTSKKTISKRPKTVTNTKSCINNKYSSTILFKNQSDCLSVYSNTDVSEEDTQNKILCTENYNNNEDKTLFSETTNLKYSKPYSNWSEVDTSHDEIKQLQFNFLEMLNEVKNLKVSISELRKIQETDEDKQNKHTVNTEIICNFQNELFNTEETEEMKQNLPYDKNDNDISKDEVHIDTKILPDQNEIPEITIKPDSSIDFKAERIKKYNQLFSEIAEVL